MKTLIITSTVMLLTSTIVASELSWVDEQIAAIKPARKSASIHNIKNPFVFLKKNGYIKREPVLEEKTISTTNAKGEVVKKVIKQKPKPLVLSAILNNTALINGIWYKQHEKIRAYTITKIDKSTVTLKSASRRVILSTNVKNQTLKFKNK